LSKLLDLKEEFEQLQNKYQEYLPKVDAEVINDLLLRQRENPVITPIYMLEVFTKEGIDSQKVKDFIFQKTGMMPAIYDNGTHYVTNQKLTLEMLKEISDAEDAQTSSPSFPALSGAIHGYVGGPEGLPAIGGTVVAAEQQTGYTVNSIVSIDGYYSFNLPAGKYIVLVAYPDGTNKKVSNFVVEQGTYNSLDFKY